MCLLIVYCQPVETPNTYGYQIEWFAEQITLPCEQYQAQTNKLDFPGFVYTPCNIFVVEKVLSWLDKRRQNFLKYSCPHVFTKKALKWL